MSDSSPPIPPARGDDSTDLRKDYPIGRRLGQDVGRVNGDSAFGGGTPTGAPPDITDAPTLFGHPAGLYTLFFAEMWERFSFYGMKALLLYYMMKVKFLRYGDGQAYAVLGAYAALVYMTPFFGGMIADRILGCRRAVVLGGLLMAAGHLLMAVPEQISYYMALGLLIAGNGFFKPNISTIVGTLYREGSPKRDGGFTIFYMGVNLGAGMAPLLCGYIGEVYGWHYGFGLATIGMLTGLAVFVAPIRVTQVMIMLGAAASAFLLFYFHPDNIFSIAVNVIVGIAMLAAGVVSCIALNRGGLPKEAGQPPDPERLRRPALGPIPTEWLIYIGAALAVPVLALLVSGFSPFTKDHVGISLVSSSVVKNMEASGGIVAVAGVVLKEVSRPAGLILFLAGLIALLYVGYAMLRMDRTARQRMYVVLTLTFFSLVFWTFFEQAATSISNFTDRNVNRVIADHKVAPDQVGKLIQFRIKTETRDPELKDLPILSQEQLGLHYGGGGTIKEAIERAIRNQNKKAEPKEIEKMVQAATKDNLFTLTGLTYLREALKDEGNTEEKENIQAAKTVTWQVAPDNVGMGIGGAEIPPAVFLSANPIYILIFGIVLSMLWTFLGRHGLEPSTPIKFALSLVQVGLGFVALWYGAQHADQRGMVPVFWLLLGYLLHTTAELFLSPVGLSMVTKLTPKLLVSTIMGIWFLATAFSEYMAAILAQFTSVGGGEDGELGIPPPQDTVHVYGDVFGQIAVAGIIAGVILLFLAPILTRWMHEGKSTAEVEAS